MRKRSYNLPLRLRKVSQKERVTPVLRQVLWFMKYLFMTRMG